MTHDMPPLLPPDQTPPVRGLADLDRFWRSVKGPGGFARPQLWCIVLGPEGERTPIFITIEDCPDRPDPALVTSLFTTLSAVVRDNVPGGSVALLYARPGPDDHRRDDRCWARALVEAGRPAPVDVWPVFLANDVCVRIAAPDDLAV